MFNATQHITLSHLAELISVTFEQTFGRQTFWVTAETSDIKNYPDRNYCFLGLVEKQGSTLKAKLDAVIWSQHYHIIKNFERSTGIRFEKNMQLLMQVTVDFKPAWGLRLQIVQIDSNYTLGKIALEKEATLNALVQKNPDAIFVEDGEYITFNKQLAKPMVLQKIALITAPDSDGQRDFMHELQNNPYGYAFEVDQFLIQMQGQQAAGAIVETLQMIATGMNSYDTVVIARGGGSQLDFGPFDTYEVGVNIALFPIPVITGIGHERNVSVADLMAHLNVKTPTKAANFIVQHNAIFENQVIEMEQSIFGFAQQMLNEEKENLKWQQQNLEQAISNFLKDQQFALREKENTIRLLHPSNVLARGYAIIKRKDKILTGARQLKAQDEIEIVMRDGKAISIIKNIENEN